jgi:hypothetical protein
MTYINWPFLLAFLYLLYRSLRPSLNLRKAATEPTCASCGYTILGLTTSTCPECGKDLLVTGIIPPGKLGLRVGRAFAWTALIFLAFCFSGFLVGLIRYYNCDASFHLTPTVGSHELLVLLDCYAEGYSPRLTPDTIEVFGFGPPATFGARTLFGRSHGSSYSQTFVPDGPRALLSYTANSREWIIRDDTHSRRVATLTDADVDAWLASIGFAPSPPLSHELLQIIDRVKSTTDLERLKVVPTTHWECNGEGHGASSGASPTLLAIDAWLFALIWAWTLRHNLFGKPGALRGAEAAFLLKQSLPHATSSV